MNLILEVLKWVIIILTIYSAPLMIWMAVTALNGLFRPKELTQAEKKKHRFAIVICARNEERVIGNLLRSLKQQDYDADKYRVYVIADNCTDQTARVAREQGATVLERFNDKLKGKGYALHWGMGRILAELNDTIDAVCIFDADNLAAPNFLTEMNNALCSDADVAIGYRDTKNIHDSWVSEVYSIYWLMLQRFYHEPRHRMGISCMVGGTGFCFKLSALGDEGWTTYSLTEDVEFSIQQVCAGHKIVPARKAVFYDEQPVTFAASVKQRFRWMIGGMQCIPLYFSKIISNVFHGSAKALDLAWYILFIPATGLAIPLNIAVFLTLLLQPALQPLFLPALIILGAANWGLAMLVAFVTLKLEGKKVRPMLRGVCLYPFFILTMAFISLGALFHPHTEWEMIEHTSQYAIEDIDIQ